METWGAQCLPVLILDDDPQMGRRLSDSLQRHGYAVRNVANAPSALACVARGDFAALIANCAVLWIPGEDAREVFRRAGSFRPMSVYLAIPDLCAESSEELPRRYCILMKDGPIQPFLQSVEEACRSARRGHHACCA
ncbi:MAG TPA: hypothetical protein VMD08_03540 [Candidatus Baltobacteraceae bacterium]|nr:hypothetical protein [Candidatus Baltobacteraceae bacterium]